MTEADGRAPVHGFWKSSGISVRKMVCVHHELTHARAEQVIEGMADERLMKNGNEGLGERVGARRGLRLFARAACKRKPRGRNRMFAERLERSSLQAALRLRCGGSWPDG